MVTGQSQALGNVESPGRDDSGGVKCAICGLAIVKCPWLVLVYLLMCLLSVLAFHQMSVLFTWVLPYAPYQSHSLANCVHVNSARRVQRTLKT